MSNVIGYFFLFLCIKSTLCLYEDQAGKFDWKQSYVGKVKETHIDFKSKTKRVFVTSENNTIACLSLKSGSILWRQVLETFDIGKIHKLFVDNDIVYTVSGIGPYLVRGWNGNTGVLTSEWVLNPIASPDKPNQFAFDSNKLIAAVIDDINGVIMISTYNIKDGSVLKSVQTSVSQQYKSKGYMYNRGIIFLNTDRNSPSLHIFDLFENSAKSHPLGSVPKRVEVIQSPYPSVKLSYDDGTARVAMAMPKELLTAPVPAFSSVAIHPFGDEHLVITLLEKDGVYHVNGFIFESHKEVAEVAGKAQHTFPLDDADITSVFCVEDRISCYLVVRGKDSSLALVNSGRVLWLREEALANIASVEMIDLPISDTEAAIEKEFNNKEAGVIGMFSRRVLSQISQLQTQLGLGDDGSEFKNTLVRDTFGLRKLIVVVTSVAKVFGIDNENGDIVWQYQVDEVEPYTQHGKPTVPFYVQRTARHHPYPAMCTLLFKSTKNKNTALFVFNPINGQPLEGGLIDVGFKVLQGVLLPKNNHEFIRGLVLLSEKETVEVYPPSAKSVAVSVADSMYLFVADSATNEVSGYYMGYSVDNELEVRKVWKLELSGEFLSVTPKNPSEKVHSQGRVLSDRSVYYKYINPNLVAFATFSNDPVHKGILNIYLVDVVSGEIKFAMTHKRVLKPVHVVHSENWVAYTYYNDKYRRSELITLDLYEGTTQSNSTQFSSLSYPVNPIVERQAYIFPHHVLAMKETITEKGITSKHVLVGLESGGVLEVPWALLDPRRPLNPTPEAREEGVIPYVPELVLPSEAIITYNQTVNNIIGIHTSPSALESTCLVFIYGLDFFYTRVTPSKTFDVLKEDFDYWLITVVLVGLTTAAWITKRLSSMKALRHGWK